MNLRRMVYSKIWDSDQFNTLTIPARLLYISLITLADDEGCFRADAKYLKRKVFHQDRPFSQERVKHMLRSITDVGLIVMGVTEKGLAGFHPNWREHQILRPDRSKPSQYSELLVANGLTPRFQATTEVKISEVKTNEENPMEGNSTQSNHRDKMIRGIEEAKQSLSDRLALT